MPPLPQSITDWFHTEVKVNEPALRAYLKTKVPEGTEVDDIMQETYAKIISVKKSQPIQSTRGLLFTIAKNLVRDVFRKKYASKLIPLRDIEEKDVIQVDDRSISEMARSDEIEMLQEAIRSLPKKCRIIFILRNYEHKSYKEIAEELKLSVKTVEAQLAIGMKKCRKYFESKGSLS